MRKYWYTWFLLASLAVCFLWTCMTDHMGKTQEAVTVRASMVSVDEENTMKKQSGVSVRDNQAEKTGDVTSALAENASGSEYPEAETLNHPAVSENYVFPVSDHLAKSEDFVVSCNSPMKGDVMTEKDAKTGDLFPDDFAGVLFIGDSRTVGLYEYGQLGEADFFAESGMNVFNLLNREVTVPGKGKKTLEQLLAENQYQFIHIMLGINELGYEMDQILRQYESVVEKIQEMEPDAKIILGANLHVTAEKAANSEIYNNDNINVLNGAIQKIGEDRNCYFIDVNALFDDTAGNLSAEYSTDGFHILAKYYAQWAEWIREQI